MWTVEVLDQGKRCVGYIPGRVVEIHPQRGSVVMTGGGVLLLEDVQFDGLRVVNASEVLNRLSITLGEQ